MKTQLLFNIIDKRVALDKDDGDHAYFHSLSLKLEYLTKIVTSGMLACVSDDVDRHRYTFEHKLIRADSIGEWVRTLNDVLVGPAAQFFDSNKRFLMRNLTERVGPGDWRYTAVSNLDKAAQEVGVDTQLGGKVALRRFFEIGAQLRNRSRGHGAITSDQCHQSCPGLADGLNAVAQRLELFRIPWAYLHQNLSGKYRVSPLLADVSSFDYLKKITDQRLSDGVYLYLNRPVYVQLIFSDPDVLDISLPNGNHRNGTFEVLSYVTNDTGRKDGSAWSAPPDQLPRSETEGGDELEPLGNAFANVPPKLSGYVSRSDLEDTLRRELFIRDRHPIVSLTGPGGIGKTAIAIAAIRDIAGHEHTPYDVILWISARDIDLLESGPKPVSPQAITRFDISRAAVELLEPAGRCSDDFQPITFFQECLKVGAAGATLFVLDNFETVQSPADVFTWIDTYIRPPNKVLITTRFRNFIGDYPIEIRGMTEGQAISLIDQHAERLGVTAQLEPDYKSKLIREADGHPYVIKILLGEVRRVQKAVTPKRVVANSEHLLKALFERTYDALSPGGRRVFLLLCSWRVRVPGVAVEAVSLRPDNDRFNVADALEELHRFSLVDQTISEEGEPFVEVPLAAAMYGRGKLEASPLKTSVEEDRKLLMEFGPGRGKDVEQSVLPRIEFLLRVVANQASTHSTIFEDRQPVLEYIATRVPKAYLRLADLVLEIGQSENAVNQAKEYVRRFLESATISDKKAAWQKLADLCQSSNDAIGEVQAISEAALLPMSDQEDLGRFANRLNNRIRDLKGQSNEVARSTEVRKLLENVIRVMENRLLELSATNCSRLAWLHLNVGNQEKARDVAKLGVDRESTNEHCQKLISRLDS